MAKRNRRTRRQLELSSLATPEYAQAQEDYARALDECTEFQRKFVVAFLACGELKQAAIEAGTTSDRPDQIGAAAVKSEKVQRAIDAGRRMYAEKYRVRAEDILEELKLIAHHNILDYEFSEDGRPIVRQGDRWKWRAVKSIKRRIVKSKGGSTEIHVEITMHPKLDAARMIGQYLGLLDGDGAEETQAPPAIVVRGVDPAQVAGLPAPSAPDVIDAEIVDREPAGPG